MTKKISMFPIFPSTYGAEFALPAGALLLGVSLNVHTYYLHALVDEYPPAFENRRISAYLDEEAIHTDMATAVYLGSCEQAGTYRRQHFFDQTARPAC